MVPVSNDFSVTGDDAIKQILEVTFETFGVYVVQDLDAAHSRFSHDLQRVMEKDKQYR